MKRLGYVAMLMVLSSSAYAGGSYSFVVRGQRISIEAPRHCRSLSCVSFHETRRGHDDIDAAPDAAPAKPLAAAPAQPEVSTPAQVVQAPTPAQAAVQTRAPVLAAAPPSIAPAGKPAIPPVVCASPQPATVALSASASKEVAAPSPPKIQPSAIQAPAPPVTAPIERPPVAARPAPVTTPQVVKISRDAEDEPEQTPLGDWQTEGNKGSVRIEQCGRALCGYILNTSMNAVGETVLINMKPKAASQWSGNIFSRDSGNTYYATMKMKGPNSLRVEACALGPFFCTGNVWSRVGAEPKTLVTSGRISSAPRS
jgi:uncharacterized protein (DUF2147 family)